MKDSIKEVLGSSIFIIIVLITVSLITLMPVLNMLILGGIIAYGIIPIANKLQTKLKYYSVSIVISIIFIVIPLILIVVYSVSVIMDLSYAFINSNNLSNNDFTSYFSFNQIINTFNTYLPIEIQASTSSISSITTTLNEFINDLLKMIFNYFIDLMRSLPLITLEIFVLIFSVFYFARDGHNLKKYVFSFIPNEKEEFFLNMIIGIKTVLKSIFYGHFLTGIIIGLIGTIGFYILGYPYALFLGILIGIFQLIPLLGPWPIYFALVIWDIISGNYIRGILTLFFGFGLSLSDMYIRPALSSKYVDIHPLILLVGFLSGPIVFGLVGFILGPLILGITFAVIKTYKEEKEKIELMENRTRKCRTR